jgi:hypothetical protein
MVHPLSNPEIRPEIRVALVTSDTNIQTAVRNTVWPGSTKIMELSPDKRSLGKDIRALGIILMLIDTQNWRSAYEVGHEMEIPVVFIEDTDIQSESNLDEMNSPEPLPTEPKVAKVHLEEGIPQLDSYMQTALQMYLAFKAA